MAAEAGGLTTKIVAMVDALGNLMRSALLPGQRHDTISLPLGDRAFDVDWLRADLDSRGCLCRHPLEIQQKSPDRDRDALRQEQHQLRSR